MFDVFYLGPKPNLFAHEKPATDLKHAEQQCRTRFFWLIHGQNDYTNFDFSYQPPPWEEHHIHIWPNQWQQDGEVYLVKQGCVDLAIKNFHCDQMVWRLPNLNYWQLNDCNLDSIDKQWAPDPCDPPYIYHFPVRWGREKVDGPRYVVPGATKVKFVNDLVAEFNQQPDRWNIPEEIDENLLDLTWRPDPTHPAYIYHFATDFQKSSGLTYTVPGATEDKFLDFMPLKETSTALKVLDIFYIDKHNSTSATRYNDLQQAHPNIQKVRYANSMFETIKRCVTRATTSKFWVISSENIYTDFNFQWHAQPWQSHMFHVFGSKWQKWSDTYLVNRWEFERISQWAKSLEEFPNLNFVDDQKVIIPEDLYDVYFIDHGNLCEPAIKLFEKFPKIKKTRFVDSYLSTLERICETADSEFIWVTSSLCDYTKFDFSWQPEPWQQKMLHVFPSHSQKYGDTFYINLGEFKKQVKKLKILEWFEVVNFVKEQHVNRLPIPKVGYQGDDVLNAIISHNFEHPYTLFYQELADHDIDYDPCLWDKKDRKIITFDNKNSLMMVPRDCKSQISNQLYDYPYISKLRQIMNEPLDVVFISNGEKNAELLYLHLCKVIGKPAKRISNIGSRASALKAAAASSKTDWFFGVPAKLEVSETFNWNWQPDMLQRPKHYIFHAKNPLNGLEYGHMAMVAYNRQLVLDTEYYELDFTMAQPHAVVPLISGTAYYNADPLMTWRTAFREVIKLLHDINTTGNIESQHRFETWLGVADGDNSMWSLLGARDALDFYNTCQGKMEFLKLTFNWQWVDNYYNKIYTPNSNFSAENYEVEVEEVDLVDAVNQLKS